MKKLKCKHYYFFILFNLYFIEAKACTSTQSNDASNSDSEASMEIKRLFDPWNGQNNRIDSCRRGSADSDVSLDNLQDISPLYSNLMGSQIFEEQFEGQEEGTSYGTYNSDEDDKSDVQSSTSSPSIKSNTNEKSAKCLELEKKNNQFYYEMVFSGFEKWQGELFLEDEQNNTILITKLRNLNIKPTVFQGRTNIFPISIELKNINTKEEYIIYGEIDISDGFKPFITSSLENKGMKLSITRTQNCSIIHPTICIEGSEFGSKWKEDENPPSSPWKEN